MAMRLSSLGEAGGFQKPRDHQENWVVMPALAIGLPEYFWMVRTGIVLDYTSYFIYRWGKCLKVDSINV